MSTLVKTTTFVDGPGHFILSAEVNQNFDEIITFLNNLVVHTDGSKVFTGIPTGPAADPTSDNQFARKAYVDAATSGVGSAVAVETAARIAAVNGEAAARVAQDAVVTSNAQNYAAAGDAALNSRMTGGRASFSCDGNGDFVITFTRTLSGAGTPGVTVTDGSGASLNYSVYGSTATTATVRVFNPATGLALPGRTGIANWTAITP